MKARNRNGHLLVALFLTAVCWGPAIAISSPPSAPAFLQQQLPLTVVLTTPLELGQEGSGDAVVSGRLTLTAVFSRPVIALGSDFGVPASQQKVPFNLSCPMPGKSRWVTTTIFRFDPDEDWPSDIACNFTWNTALTSYDGVPLSLGSISRSRRLASDSLAMWLLYVTSERATYLTDGLWTSGLDPPEVPPDGKIALTFWYLVNLQMLQSALKFAAGAKGDGQQVAFNVTPCQSPAPWLPAASSGLSLDVNSTCAVVTPRTSLAPGATYLIYLPKGVRYHALAGPLTEQLNVTVTGLLPFTFPFNWNLGNGVEYGTTYRRLDVELIHGLSNTTTPAALAARMKLCQGTSSSCANPVPFNFSLVSRGQARLTVPSLKPQTQYRLTVAAKSTVKDGFGQSLQSSSLTFWTQYVQYNFAAPNTRRVGVIDAAVDTLSAWPYITRSLPESRFISDVVTAPSVLQGWEVDLTVERTRVMVAKLLLQNFFYSGNLSEAFGAPTTSVPVPGRLRAVGGGQDWTQLLMPLRNTSKPSRAQVVSYCCDKWGRTPDAKLIVNTSISANVIQSANRLTAWVLDSRPGGGPVVGAQVSVYRQPFNGPSVMTSFTQADPVLLARCTTDSQGACAMTTTATGTEFYSNMVVLVTTPNNGVAVVDSAGYTRPLPSVNPYVGNLVVDRLLVVPGDDLKVTGFLQKASSTGLSLPPTTYAALIVSPGWSTPASSSSGDSSSWSGDSARGVAAASVASASVASGIATSAMPWRGPGSMASSPPVYIPVKINGTTGTFHAVVSVPEDARLQSYTLSLVVPTSPVDPSGPEPSSETLSRWPHEATGSPMQVTVADPRPPTAELKLETPPWVRPTGVVSLRLTAVSYIGASVDNSPITVTWTAGSNAAGVLTLTTNVDGVANGSIDLGALPEANRTDLTDTLSVNAEWIGPTRERITQSGSVILANASASLTLDLSLPDAPPGTAFALSATLTSNENGATLSGQPVIATLRPTAPGAATCGTTTSCTTTTGSGMDPNCQLALPCVGHFVLEACTQLPPPASVWNTTGESVCTNLTLGKNVTEWAASPLRNFPEPQLFTDKTSYTQGDIVTVSFQNPWNCTRVLLFWGNGFRSKYKIVQKLTTGLSKVPLSPLGDECLGGCSVLALFDTPRRLPGTVPLPPRDQLAVSQLFDPDAPHTFSKSVVLDVRTNNALAVNVSVAAGAGAVASSIRDVSGGEVLALEPGAKAKITVRVNTTNSGPVEVTVYAVDKAFLDLLPYGLPLPQQQMLLRLASDMSAYGMDANRLAPGAVRAVFDKLLSRLANFDPWLPLDTDVTSSGWSNAVDMSDENYLARYYAGLTLGLGYSYPGYTDRWPGSALGPEILAGVRVPPGAMADESSASALPSTPNKGGSSGNSSSTSTSLRVEEDFVVTPLFATAIAKTDGSAVVTFNAPQNLGTLVIRAFAAAGSVAKYGAAEGKLAVRRRVSLTPSVPRFVRVGDKFEAGVVVTVGSAPSSVQVALKVENEGLSPLTLLGVSSKRAVFSAGGGVQQEVRFYFVAAAVGSANLTFTAADEQAGGGQDALQLDFPVYGQQADVYVATSFALPATPEGSGVLWQEGMELPAAVPGSGGLTLTAGVGYFPALASMYNNLQQQDKDRTNPSAMPAMLWATLPAVLSYYGQSVTNAQSIAVLGGFSDLDVLTSGTVGLMWSNPSLYSGWYPWRTDLYLNTWALFLVNQHAPAFTASTSSQLPSSLAPFVPYWTSVGEDKVQRWRAAVESQLVADAVAARAAAEGTRRYNDWNTLAWARLVLGALWTPPSADPAVKGDLSLATLIRNNGSMSRQSRVVLALVLNSLGSANPAPRLLNATRDEVVSALRVQGRTAYVAAGPGIASASSTSDQALSLLLLLRVAPSNPLLPRLAAYVADPAAAAAARGFGLFGPLPGGLCPYDQGLAVAALTEYDRVRGSAKPNVRLTADANGLTVLQAAFTPGGSTRPVSNTTAWEALPPPQQGAASDLSFQVVGTGEVSVAASLHFVPVALLGYPTYRGLFVEGVLQLVEPLTGQPTGRRVTAVPLGSTVAYTVQLTTPDDLGAVTLSVLMPGGLEPLDPNVAQGLGFSCGDGWVESNWWSGFRWWFWPVCPAQETRPSAVTFSYLGLRAGTSSVTIRAVAATVGTFVLPPIRASADTQPELMGLSAAGTFTVCGNCSTPTYGTTPAPLKPCPNDCSGNGLCNLTTGKCTCDPSWTRSDCSRPVA